jgi:hypothetical protein
MNRYLLTFSTYFALGLPNLFRVLYYRIKLKSGFYKIKMPIGESQIGPFYAVPNTPSIFNSRTQTSEDNTFNLFGWLKISSLQVPNWHQSVLTKAVHQKAKQHWSGISDFDSGVGDIKGIWELSRFSWVLTFGLKYGATKDIIWLQKINQWIQDWSSHNPSNQGANWKCAQEASFRILHMAATSLVINQLKPNAAMALLITSHLKRISPTLSYAKAQDNNHGTSEGAALYVGGTWLLLADPEDLQARKWCDAGRAYLHERVARLIEQDGTFSQYSVTYHRLMMDTLSLVELWRKRLDMPKFSKSYVCSLRAATKWLLIFIDTASGDTPNLGANDGAHILNFSGAPVRDFRPSAELSCQLFLQKTAFSSVESKVIREMFDLYANHQFVWPNTEKLVNGGYGIIRSHSAFCVLNVPNFRFRPSQADMLHLDFWLKGENLLKDAGSFSYNTQPKWLTYFSGVEGHNTVQFDNRQPMPKLSRFLYGKWPKFRVFDVKQQSMQVEYVDWKNAVHARTVELVGNQLIIKDTLSGQFNQACLRWRLADLDWQVQGHSLLTQQIQLSISSSESLTSFTLARGFESRYYGKKTPIPVLEIVVANSTQITTIISWN